MCSAPARKPLCGQDDGSDRQRPFRAQRAHRIGDAAPGTPPGTAIIWLMRKERVETAFGGEAADALPERGALGSQARSLVESGAVEVVTPFSRV